MKPKVAIIIPVYNVEQYLKQCLDSIINQTLKEIQILCINDGSTDGSLNILKEYAKEDKRIQIFNKENGGLGSARNLGIKFINAECVYFVDSDDWLEIDALEKLYSLLQKTNADIVLSGALAYIDDIEKFFPTDFSNILHKTPYTSGATYCYQQIKPLIFTGFGAPFKFYRYDFLKTLLINEKLYPESNKLCGGGAITKLLFEDVFPSIKSLLLAKRICILKEDLYYYRIRKDSIMRSGYSYNEGIFDIFVAIKQVEQFLLAYHIMDELKNEFSLFVCECINFHLRRCSKAFKERFIQQSQKIIKGYDGSYFTEPKTEEMVENILKLQGKGAVERVKNHLAYKLGKAIIDTKSPLKILKLPFTLIKIIQTHKFESKVLKTLYKTHPQLKLPALENYADYEEALKTKEHLSYRLGEAMLKNPLTFIFKFRSLYTPKRKGK
ncbi:glycosyltransferase family 2 protein [Helicobacter mesocricetorum]|uniref:glycosyltransferase family 2 protein n=1 Tax=Helicobacter mesocricetorum TaxID=87012 RepID=UPI000CF1C412|nr:glycosyltransferase family 2 protein [Helicobacter mesocricetorum]